jgi:SAM-dependent methyltransferase
MFNISLATMLKAPMKKCRRFLGRTTHAKQTAPEPQAIKPERDRPAPSSAGHSDPRQPGFNPYRLVWECQEEITARRCKHGPDACRYGSRYRLEEVGYWRHVPAWMHEDFRARLICGEPPKCLDVGCAYGTLLLYAIKLLGCEPYAVDFINYLDPSLVADYGIHYLINNIERDAFPWPVRFDVILLTEVLEHLNFQAIPTLEKLRALLAPGGRLYLTTPDAAQWGRQTKYYARYADLPVPSAGSQAPVIDDHVWQFEMEELTQLVTTAGFRIVRRDYAPGGGLRHSNLTLMAS